MEISTIDDEECGPEEQWEQKITNWLHSVEAVIPSLRRRHYPHFARVYLLALWPPDALHELLPELVLNQSIAITLGPGQLMTLTMSPLENVHAYSYSRAPTSLQLTLRQQIPFLPWMITVAVHKKGNQNLVGESIVQTPCLAPGWELKPYRA